MNGWDMNVSKDKFEKPLAPPDAFEQAPRAFVSLAKEAMMDKFFSNPQTVAIVFILLMVVCLVVRYGAPTVGIELPPNALDLLDKAAIFCASSAGITFISTNALRRELDAAQEDAQTKTSALERLVRATDAFLFAYPLTNDKQEGSAFNQLFRVKDEIQKLLL